MRDYSGFNAVVAAIERARESIENDVDRLVIVSERSVSVSGVNLQESRDRLERSLREKFNIGARENGDGDARKQTALLGDVKTTLNRILSNALWTARRTQWQVQKATRPFSFTPVQIAEKKFSRSLTETSPDGKATALAFRAASEVFLAKLHALLEKSFPKKNLLGTGLKVAGLAAAFPVASVLFGGLAKVGESVSKDFSERMASQMQKTSKIDFGAAGSDVGQALGSGLQKGVLDFAALVEESIASEGNEIAPKFADLIGKIFDNLILSLSKAGLALPRGYQRMQYQRLAIPEVKEMAGQMMIDRSLSDSERSEIEGKKSISLVVGGVNMDESAGNTDYVSRLMKPLLKGSHVVPVKNTWSNAPYDPAFKTQFMNLIKTAFNTPVLGKMIIENIKDMNAKMGADSDFKAISDEDFQDPTLIAQKVLAAFSEKDMPIGKGLEAVFKGYNPDDVKVAAEALYYRQQFPEMPINVIGTSFGGFNAAGASQLLEMMGVEGIKGAGITTPFTGIMSPPNEENFLGSIGTKDMLHQGVEKVLGNFNLSKEFQQVIEGAGVGHLLPLFMGNAKFQGRFQELNKGRFQFKKGIDERSVNYFSKRYQNPEDENLTRTVLEMGGMPQDEGYRYDADTLKGFRKEISKKSKGVTDEEMKKEVQAYLDFIDAVIEDLETIGNVSEFGINAKPHKSIEKGKKAVSDFPDIEVEGEQAPIPEGITRQAAAMKSLIAFRKKLRSEVKNFTATLAALQGQIPKEGWAFFDKGEDFGKRFKALQEFTNWLENDLLANASDLEKGLAKPFLDFMRKLETESTSVAGGGEFDGGLIAEFEALFGADGEINQSLQLSAENLQRYYAAYLQQVIETAKREADEQIRVIAPNYENLTIQGKRDFASGFNEEIKEDARRFRAAMTAGDRQLSRSIGESLLRKIQSVKKVYKDLIDNAEDLSGRRSMQGQVSYLSAVETEVVQGQPSRRGMSDTGLTQLVSDANSSGEETARGFARSVSEDVGRAIGLNFARSVGQGAREGLDIQSPSKVFEEIGENVAQGFERGVSDLEDLTLEQVENFASAADEGIAGFVGNARAGFTSFFDGLFERFPVLKELTDLLLGLGAGVVVGNALESIASWLVGLANSSFDAVSGLESLRKALISVTGSAESGAKGLAYVRGEANRLGIDLKTAEEAYTGLKAVTRFTAIQGLQADRIFSSFSETAATRGLSNEEQSRMFAAINQMIAKRKLSAEEVRGQLGEIPGLAFEPTLSRALGVNPAQLAEMMGNGQLLAEDVLPKVSAQYAAENAAISGSSETTAQAMTRLNNAILGLQRGFEGWVAGSKPLFSAFASGIETIAGLIPDLVKAMTSFIVAVFIQFGEDILKFVAGNKLVQSIIANTLKIISSFYKYLIPQLLSFAATFVLVNLAFSAVGNAIEIANNAFPEMREQIEKTKASVNALESAFKSLGVASQNLKPDLPVREEDITASKNWNFFGKDTGFNLEGVRKTIIKEQKRQRERMEKIFGKENLPAEKQYTTLGQSELADFQVNIGDSLIKIDQVLLRQFDAKKVLEDIKEIDKQLTKMRSRRFNIPAGDREAYNQSIAAEQKILEERDKKLKVTSQFQQTLENSKAAIQADINRLNELAAKKGITANAEANLRAALEERLSAVEKTRITFEDLTASLAKSVNALSLALRNLNENAAYFNETLERNATNARVQFLRKARNQRVGTQVTELGTDQIDRQTLEARVTFLKDQLGAVNEYLSKPDFSALLEELRSQAKSVGLNLENTATIDRLLGENRSGQETAVLEALKQQLALKDQIGQTEETVERSITQARTTLIDLNRSVEDYFFNLTQQIKEALVEVDRLLNQLKYGSLKTKLQRALVPGSDTFVNGLVSQIQGIFDQAASITEQILGQRSARINFAGERRGLQVELENFTNSLGGATEAIEVFRKALLGGTGGTGNVSSSSVTPNTSGNSDLGQKIVAAALQNEGWGKGIGLQCANAVREVLKDAGINIGVTGKPFDAALMGTATNPARANSFGPDQGTVINRIKDLKPGDIVVFRDTYAGINNRAGDKEITHVGIYLGDGQVMDHSRKGGFTQHALKDREKNFYRGIRLNGSSRINVNTSKIEANLDKLLRKYNSPLKARDFIEVSQQTGVSVDSLVTQAMIESHFGTRGRAVKTRNPLNYGNDDTGKNKYFKTFKEGLLSAAQGLKKDFFFSTPEDFIARNFKGRFGIYATDPQYKQKYQSTLSSVRGQLGVSPSNNNQLSAGADSTRARDLTETLVKIKNRQVNLGDASVRQEIENFVINLQQTRETILRQMGDSIRTSRQSVVDAKNQFIDTRRQYSPQTQTSQLESDLQGIKTQFSTLDTQLFEQERGLQDNIKGLKGLLGQLTPVIQVLRSSGQAVDQQSADFLQGLVGQIEGDKKSYEGMLVEISGLREQLKSGKIDAENFVQAQARLRQVQSDLERIGTELAIAQGQNNAQMERSIGLLQSRQQLEADILQISNDFADNDSERLKRIELAKEQARLRELEIQYQYESKQLTKELELIEKRVAIAQSLSNLEKRKELALLQSQKQLEQEILEIKKQYPDIAEQELRIKLARDSGNIRERDIKNQFTNDSLSRREETNDLDSQINEGYANRLEAGGDTFGAADIRQRSSVTGENLRYQRQVEGIRQQYADDPARTDELVKKATILRDLNLENIDRQFKDLGETISSVAGDAFGNFFSDVITGTKSLGEAFADMAVSILKSIAQIAVQIAVTSVLKSLGGAFGGGGTVGVGNFDNGGTIGEALQREGHMGVVAVFTPGEEILSLKTGEAGRYQRLKKAFGDNPLKNIFNFADGGTVGDNLLNNLGNNSPAQIRFSSNFGDSLGAKSPNAGNRSVNITVVTPDVGGFNRSERQLGRAAAELLRRS